MYKFDSAGPFANVALSTTIATLYTVPTGKILQLTAILTNNNGNQDEHVEYWLNSQDDTHIWIPKFAISKNTRKVRRTLMNLAAGTTILGLTFDDATYTNKVYFNLHGVLVVN